MLDLGNEQLEVENAVFMNVTSIFEPNRFPRQTLLPMNPEWANLFGEGLAEMDPWLRLGYSPASLTRYFSTITSDRQIWAILDRESPAACLTVRPDWLRGPLLELLAVLPQHQGKGIGKDMIAWLAGETRRQGKANLWTISSEFNHAALAFYRRQGFEEAGVLPDLISLGETERLLRLRL